MVSVSNMSFLSCKEVLAIPISILRNGVQFTYFQASSETWMSGAESIQSIKDYIEWIEL